MSVRPAEESFDYTLYKSLLSKDQEIIDEYIPKMSAEEINSFMRRFVEHYPLETERETLEVSEEQDSILVFESSSISKTDSINNFIETFISTTKSSEAINTFFASDSNFNYVVQNPRFYKNSSQVFHHIVKYFRLNKSLRGFLENQKELNSFIWEGFQAYFENKKLYRGELYSYVGSIVNRKLRQDLDIGFICPFCSTYYIRDSLDKNSLITCSSCQNRFSFAGIKCPTDGCGKIIPITSIDTKVFNPADVKHTRAFRALNQYLNPDDMNYIAKILKMPEVVDAYKIPISAGLHKKKIKKLEEYSLSEDAATSIPEFLFYLPLTCPITTGHTRAKHISSGQKYDAFRGCGSSFQLKDGLRKALRDGYFVYRLHDQRRIRYADPNKNKENYNDGILVANNEIADENKIPYDRIVKSLNKYFVKAEPAKNKPMSYFSKAIKKYFEEEYTKSVDGAVKTFLHNLSNDDFQYIKSFENYISDQQLQKNLFYKNPPAYRLGWTPSNDIQERIREIYIELVQDREELVRKITNAKLPMRFYTYRISEIYDRPTTYKKRIGVAIDKTVLPATKRASAGYGQNFKMDKKFISIKLIQDGNTIDISKFVKNGVYWSTENAELHGFDNKTGIIWFDGSAVTENIWEFPDGTTVVDNSDTIVDVICAPDSFSKMYQRFDLNGKMREIVSELETEGHI